MPLLSLNQQYQSTEGKTENYNEKLFKYCILSGFKKAKLHKTSIIVLSYMPHLYILRYTTYGAVVTV